MMMTGIENKTFICHNKAKLILSTSCTVQPVHVRLSYDMLYNDQKDITCIIRVSVIIVFY